MQEFSSITASSYDAESLAPMLTAKSAEGWEIVSIVAAGTNIVAYLSRESAGSGSASGESDDVSVAASSVAAAAVAAAAVAEMPADASTNDSAAVVDTPTLPGNDTPYVPADSSIPTESAATPSAADDAAAAIAEPAGWAVAPDNDVAELAAQVGADDAATDTATDTATDIAAAGMADSSDQAVDAAGGSAAESSVPAGWYADPSGRYELRYWDGGAWTEHVSRAGQQFTDPPVA
ncbi:MAG: hypothetical protein ACJAQ9_002967 [Ilumatobacter sp.]|jgi:hypothetical protein